MPSTYGFLRFQLAGLGVALYWVIFVSPFISAEATRALLSDGQTLLTALGALFVVAMPVGYILHQFVVNRYRGTETQRPAHHLVRELVNETHPGILDTLEDADREFTFIDGLLTFALGLPTGDGTQASSTVSEPTSAQLEKRWSYFYARTALGNRYGIPIAAFLTLLTVFVSLLPPAFPWQPVVQLVGGKMLITLQSASLSLALFVCMGAVAAGMNTYVRKLKGEIISMECMLFHLKAEHFTEFLEDVPSPEALEALGAQPQAPKPNAVSRLLGLD